MILLVHVHQISTCVVRLATLSGENDFSSCSQSISPNKGSKVLASGELMTALTTAFARLELQANDKEKNEIPIAVKNSN